MIHISNLHVVRMLLNTMLNCKMNGVFVKLYQLHTYVIALVLRDTPTPCVCIDLSLATFSPPPPSLHPPPSPPLLPHPTLNGGQVTSNSDEGSDSSVSDGAPLGHFSLEPSIPEREEGRRRKKRRKLKSKRSSVQQTPKMKMAHSEGVCTYVRLW